MNSAGYAIKYKQLTFVILLIMIATGIFSFITMPRQEDPDVNPPVAQVVTTFPGANPLQVEQLVTNVIEGELSEITAIKRTTSSTGKGYSSIIIELDHHNDAEAVWSDVREKLNQVEQKLPAEVNEPQFNTELVKTVTTLISVSGLDLRSINQVALSLEAELAKLPPVASVNIIGEQKQEVIIDVDNQKLSGYRLSLAQIVNSVKGNNISTPGPSVDLGTYQATLNTPNQHLEVSDIAETVVGISLQGWPLPLAEVAQVSWAHGQDDFIIRTNSQPAIALEVMMKDRENVVNLGKDIDRVLALAKTLAPPDVSIRLIADQPRDVGERLSNFTNTLLFGMFLVILTVFLAMGWRNALVVSLAIPFSVTLAFAGMGWWQISLHQVSIAALVIALGILVDNAIVVNDNIYRHWQQGTPLLESCSKGLKEVAIPVLSSTLTTIAAFIPLMLMPGDVGEFIKSIPQVVSLTLLSSLLIAATVTPLIFYLLMKNKKAPAMAANFDEADKNTSSTVSRVKERLNLNILVRLYQQTLHQALARPGSTLVIALVFLTGSILLISQLGVEFFPPSDKKLVMVQVAAPAGTNLKTTDDLVKEVEKFLAEQPQVKDFTSFIGRGVPKFYYNVFPSSTVPNLAQIMVNLDPSQGLSGGEKEPVSISVLATDWQNKLQNQLGSARVRVELLEQGPPVGAPVAFRISGPDLEILANLADEATAALRTIPGTTAQNHSLAEQELSIETVVSLDKAAMSGVTRLDAAGILRYVAERQEIDTIKWGTEEIPIKLTLTNDVNNQENLANLWVTSSVTGNKVPLGQVATFEPSWQWSTINHWKSKRTVFVYSYLESNTSANDVYNQVVPLLNLLAFPPGYTLEIGGQMEDQVLSFTNLAQAGITAVLLIYLILIFQFNSLLQPLLIIIAIPFTIVGSVVGLYLMGYSIGFMAFLGIVSLVGIVVNNSIVLVDFINCRRREGMTVNQAIISAGKQRLRPILLTTATTIGGLLPLSITGGSLWGPMGFAIIFGLLGSTILTLIVLPVLYMLTEGRKESNATAKSAIKEVSL